MWTDEARHVLGALIDDRDAVRSTYRVDAWPLAVKRAHAGVPGEAPAAVALPQSTEDVSRVLAWAAAHDVPVVPWGAGSSVTGAPLPSADALVLDLRGLRRILEIDPYGGRAVVEAGLMGGEMERVLAEHAMTTWLSPQSLHRSTVGGWVATRATGQFSSRWGGIEDAVGALRVVLADGTIVRVGTPPRGAVGPDLKNLFIGSEGAFGVITEVTLRIHPLTMLSGLESYALPDVETGIEAIRRMMISGLRPALCRLYDADEACHLAVPQPPSGAVLLVGFAGIEGVAEAERHATAEILEESGATSLGSSPVEAWLATRFDFSRIERILGEPGGYAETIEISHGWKGILSTYRDLKASLAPLADDVMGHFSHAYTDGISLYVILLGRADDAVSAVRRLEAIWETAMEVALRDGAVISHHHGIGRARAPFLAEQLGEGAVLLEKLKLALDPRGMLHPGSLVPSTRSINGAA